MKFGCFPGLEGETPGCCFQMAIPSKYVREDYLRSTMFVLETGKKVFSARVILSLSVIVM